MCKFFINFAAKFHKNHMITGSFPLAELQKVETPIYYYDMSVLRRTIDALKLAAPEPQFRVHYAVKACATREILDEIARNELGADCASGAEVEAALRAGIRPEKVVFSGIAKTDREIRGSLRANIFCFNVESEPELEVINQIAQSLHKRARVCLRVNPNIEAHPQAMMQNGMTTNQFGIAMQDLENVVRHCITLPGIEFAGLHFHIGSQITDLKPFEQLADRVNELVEKIEQISYTDAQLETQHVTVSHINLGGGLGILYDHPNHFPIPDFENYFRIFRERLKLREDQMVHFELGRSIVAQCGSLLTRVLYVKKGNEKSVCVVDAGLYDLMRPARYGAFHRVENLTHPDADELLYNIVGPAGEAGDVYVEGYKIAEMHRGDLLAIRSAGAYGEIMATQYNLRRLPGHVTSDDLGFLSLGF